MNRRITQVALAAAAAMTISLASPVSAQASESAGITAPPKAASAQALTPTAITRNPGATPTVTRLVVGKGTLTYEGTNTSVPAIINYNIPEGWSMIPKARITQNGRSSGIDLFDGSYLRVPTRWGAGAYRVDNITFRKYDGTATYVAPAAANFRVRQGVTWRYSPITKRGSKITFKLRGFQTFNGTRWVSVKKVKLQVKKGKKWKTIKNVKVNKNGHGNVKVKSKKKRAYRVYIPTTTRVQGAVSRATKI